MAVELIVEPSLLSVPAGLMEIYHGIGLPWNMAVVIILYTCISSRMSRYVFIRYTCIEIVWLCKTTLSLDLVHLKLVSFCHPLP